LEKAVEAHYIEQAAQKVRKIAKAKIWKKAKKQRLAEKKKKLWNEVLAEDATLLEITETFQVAGVKQKNDYQLLLKR